ncbi:hypothetical protein D3C84_1239000 [compost metagenome]
MAHRQLARQITVAEQAGAAGAGIEHLRAIAVGMLCQQIGMDGAQAHRQLAVARLLGAGVAALLSSQPVPVDPLQELVFALAA